MANQPAQTWTCKRYGTTMLAETAEAFCARRHAAAIENNGDKSADFAACRECVRGAALFDLGLHKSSPRRHEDTKKIARGETTMKKEFHKTCARHGAFTTTGPAGKCPQCKAEEKPISHEGTKITKKKNKALVPVPGDNPSMLSVSIDLSRYPKLHSRLIGLALDRVLEEMEAKA